MAWIHRLFRSVNRKDETNNEIDKELQFHIEELTRENVSGGMSPAEARRQARIAFGGERQIAEDCASTHRVSWLDDFFHDLRFGWRMLFKTPGYTIGAILALSLGIGPNTAFFTLFDALFLRPLPVPLSERVVEITKSSRQLGILGAGFSYPEYRYYRDHNTLFDDLSVNIPSHQRLHTGPGVEEPVMGLFVTPSYFSVMHVAPAVGAGFTTQDEQRMAAPYSAMLSENFWERRFARDPAILGQTLTFSGIPTTIVGITPRDFMGARSQVPDVWLPLAVRQTALRLDEDPAPCCALEGRLKAGVRLTEAQAELTQLANAFDPGSLNSAQGWTVAVTGASAGLLANTKPGQAGGPRLILFSIFQVAIGLVLLIACANVTGLLLGRAITRHKEIAVRLSLGAGRGRLIRQLLTEALIIAQLAGLLSMVMSWWILKVLLSATLSMLYNAGFSDGGSFPVNVSPDLRVFVYSLGISSIAAAVFALLPALQTTRLNVVESLNEETPSIGGGRRAGFQGWMVAAQITVCLVLLIAAATLVRSSSRLLTTDPGFNPDHVIAISLVSPTLLGYSPSRSEAVRNDLRERLSVLPGITSFATASRIPLAGLVSRTTITPLVAFPNVVERFHQYPFAFVSAGYFETVGIPMVHGRSFTADEISNGTPVAVISDALASRFWPGKDPLGQTITVGSSSPSSIVPTSRVYLPSAIVVGVVRDIYSDTMFAPDGGALYLPSAQGEDNIFIRTGKDPAQLVPPLASELQSTDPGLAPTFRTMSSIVEHDSAFIVLRSVGIAFSILGLLGLTLASCGIYSMVGYAVRRQTREIGIRMALGAQRTDVRRMILLRSLVPVAGGLAAGVVCGMALSFLMSRLSNSLRPLDPLALTGISIIIIFVASLAAYLPARRATNLDPSTALRNS